MCGIFGAVALRGKFGHAEERDFRRAIDLVHYRGPDDAGYQTLTMRPDTSTAAGSFDVFLGHRRLSILDLSPAGHQPMTDGQGCWITYNGEIFNFVELREELKRLGHTFQSDSDTEVLLRVYRQWGPDGFRKLNGMWAFVLADTARRKVVVCRDRFSIKPLYVLRAGDSVFFGSEIKQLLPFLASREIDPEVMSAFLSQALLDHSEKTFFHGIRRVAPKTYLTLDLDSGTISDRKYWDFGDASAQKGDNGEAFRDLFIDSIRIRLRSDVKVGCLLSGGLDSSAIATVANQLTGGKLETYSVFSEDAGVSEQPFVEELKRAIHVRNTPLWFKSEDVLASIDSALYHSDEPFGGFSVIAQYKMMELIKRETDVVVLLSGQGGDEALLGYLKFFFFYLKTLLKSGRYVDAAAEVFGSLLRRTVLAQFRLGKARRYVPFLRGNTQDMGLRLPQAEVPIWASGDLTERQIADIDSYSVPALTHYEDRNAMAFSLEVRHPFLDHRLLEYAVALPVSTKIHDGWMKYVLRTSFPEMPDAIRWRRDKQPFIIPEESWLKADLRPAIQEMFRASLLDELGVLDAKKFLNYYKMYLEGKPVYYMDLSRCFIAEMWVRKMMGEGATAMAGGQS